jgi:hypothetical protein
MKKLIKRKKVIVKTKGYIAPLATVGPMSEPCTITMDILHRLIMGGYRVIEILKNGKEVELSAMNYDKENGDPNDPSMQSSFEIVRPRGYKNDSLVSVIPNTDNSEAEEALKNSTLPEAKKSPEMNVPANKYKVPGGKKNKHKGGREHIDLKMN